jgi:hypothetical protein
MAENSCASITKDLVSFEGMVKKIGEVLLLEILSRRTLEASKVSSEYMRAPLQEGVDEISSEAKTETTRSLYLLRAPSCTDFTKTFLAPASRTAIISSSDVTAVAST